mmetsp:Transcript_32446/g.67076  ORF Transcript_32446/g.67076 Transcript_32446/m.67076 type:complete len:250 (+) Transcript_32446:169-918(+)
MPRESQQPRRAPTALSLRSGASRVEIVHPNCVKLNRSTLLLRRRLLGSKFCLGVQDHLKVLGFLGSGCSLLHLLDLLLLLLLRLLLRQLGLRRLRLRVLLLLVDGLLNHDLVLRLCCLCRHLLGDLGKLHGCCEPAGLLLLRRLGSEGSNRRRDGARLVVDSSTCQDSIRHIIPLCIQLGLLELHHTHVVRGGSDRNDGCNCKEHHAHNLGSHSTELEHSIGLCSAWCCCGGDGAIGRLSSLHHCSPVE